MDGVDEVLLFDHLSDGVLREIVQLHLEDIRQRLAERSVDLEVSESAVKRLVEKGHSREYGARNLGRTVEGLVLKPLARFLLGHPGVRAVAVKTVEGDIEVGRAGEVS
jgi:ATP-dependent Clp protease ATP-binding subunit ClpA